VVAPGEAYASRDTFTQDWGQVLKPRDFDRLSALVGVMGSQLKDQLTDIQDITIGWDQACLVFGTRQLASFVALVDATLPNAKELPPDSFGALVALVYNRGAVGFSAPGDRNKEMRAIKELVSAREFGKVAEQIRSMKRLWPEIPGLQRRRDVEAALFDKGFAVHDEQSAANVEKK
jgi:hypothetical protein